MKTPMHHFPLLLNRWLLVASAACCLTACLPAQASRFSTETQRKEVDTAIDKAGKAAESASNAQKAAPDDDGQKAINAAEDAADAANEAAIRAADDAERARQRAAELEKNADNRDKAIIARKAKEAAEDAKKQAKEAEDAAKQAERAAKKAVDDQIKADKGANKRRLHTHSTRERQRETRRDLAKAIINLDNVWGRTKLDPRKEGVRLTEEERKATQDTINKGRSTLGWDPRAITAMLPVLPPNTLASLVAAHKIETEVAGTGKTIGHIASIRLKNLTSENISVAVLPLILESTSGKSQHYVCPRGETITLPPQGERVIKSHGVCVSRSKPPVGEGVAGDLAINDGRSPGGGITFSPQQVDKLVRSVASYYDGAEKLEKEGKLKKMPYKDPEMRCDIVTQWGVWCDPRICTLTKETPATKEDLAKTVYRQAAEHAPLTAETKQKLDTGITDIFANIQLTNKEAKELETASPFADVELTGERAKPGTLRMAGGEAAAKEPKRDFATQPREFNKKEKEALRRALEGLPEFLRKMDMTYLKGESALDPKNPAGYNEDGGIIVYDEFFKLTPEKQAKVLRHELAHQWHHQHLHDLRSFLEIGWQLERGKNYSYEDLKGGSGVLGSRPSPSRKPDARFPSRFEGDAHAATNPIEDFGVSLEMYLDNPEELRKQSPERYKWFQEYLPNQGR